MDTMNLTTVCSVLCGNIDISEDNQYAAYIGAVLFAISEIIALIDIQPNSILQLFMCRKPKIE